MTRGVIGDDAEWRGEPGLGAPRPRVEPSPRWVRTQLAGLTIADSRQPMLHVSYGPPIRAGSHKPELPTYFFPSTDVVTDVLAATEVVDGRQWFDATIDGKRYDHVAWAYAESGAAPPELAEHITFDWDRMDAWFEEDEEIYEHARDPQHRVDVLASSRQVSVGFDGAILASSNRPHLLFETSLPTRYYLPPKDVNFDLLEESPLVTRCPYKGTARFWSVAGAGRAGRNVAWSYPEPIAENPKIASLVAFYSERVDITVDGELQERPSTPWS